MPSPAPKKPSRAPAQRRKAGRPRKAAAVIRSDAFDLGAPMPLDELANRSQLDLVENGSQLETGRRLKNDNLMSRHNADTPDTDAQDVELIKKTLRGIMRDKSSPAAAKAQAARTLAEMVQLLGKDRRAQVDPSRALASLTRAELEAELAAIPAK